LNGDRDTVRASVVTVLGGLVDAGGEEETDGDSELVAGDDGTTNLLGRNLGHVQDDGGGDDTDTETGDGTADDKKGYGGGGDLKDDTDTRR
jgi:hypothetical protein